MIYLDTKCNVPCSSNSLVTAAGNSVEENCQTTAMSLFNILKICIKSFSNVCPYMHFHELKLSEIGVAHKSQVHGSVVLL